MKKLNLVVSLLMFGAVMTTYMSCKSKAADNVAATVSLRSDLAIPALHERKGDLATATEWAKTKEKVAELQAKIASQANDVKSRLQLATIYMTEARITGEHPYYYPAILKILDGVLTLDSKNFEALVYKASVKLSQHDFVEARRIAEEAKAINTDNAYLYGVLIDANVELGNYDEAVALSDKMQSLKPSLESYARVSYLREIHGDLPGAIEAMKLAAQAGVPGTEPWCWSKRTLAQLYEKTNSWDQAAAEYETIIAIRPSYAFAMEGLAGIEKHKKNYSGALKLLRQAAAIMPEFSFYEGMADIYIIQGEKDKAIQEYGTVIGMLQEDERSGHSTALEMCRIYTKMGSYKQAIEQGMKEYALRPLNIDVNQALAWAYYNNKESGKARIHIEKGLRTGSKDPELLARAGLIKNPSVK